MMPFYPENASLHPDISITLDHLTGEIIERMILGFRPRR
jgi:hypothetical protein